MERPTFNLKRFDNAQLVPRTEEVEVVDLREYFDGEGPPIWTVRGLSGEEMYRVKNSVSRDRMISAVMSSFAGTPADKITAVKELFGVGEEVDEEAVRRIEMLVIGSVNPKLDRQAAVKLLNRFPITAGNLTDTILKLTGLGSVPGKLPGSGEMPASGQP